MVLTALDPTPSAISLSVGLRPSLSRNFRMCWSTASCRLVKSVGFIMHKIGERPGAVNPFFFALAQKIKSSLSRKE
jgi:hypothetical protein